MLNYVQNFYSVSPKEARGILGMTFLSALMLIFPAFLKHYLFRKTPGEVERERILLDSAIRVLISDNRAEQLKYKGVIGRNVPAGVRTPFDPNTAPDSVLSGAGIPPNLVQRIVNYRSKGGSFRKAADLKRIYGFPDSLYKELEPFLHLRATAHSGPQSHPEQKGNSPPKFSPYKSPIRGEPRISGKFDVLVPFDINKADTSALQKLKGIGSARARIIVNYRNSLGGFHDSRQFIEIFGLDTIALESLRKYARILSPPDLIALNTVSLEDFAKHPYLRRNRKDAVAIIRYREQHGPFASAAELGKIVAITPQVLEKIMPYLTFR